MVTRDPNRTVTFPPNISGQEREHLRARSKALFGNRDRLEVAVAITLSPDGAVNATDLAKVTGLANNRVRNQLLVMAAAGLLAEMPPGGEHKRWYVRQDSPFWQACLDLYEKWV
jgi:hypothetical protein